MKIEIGYPRATDRAHERVQRSVAWAAPLLPYARRTAVPRWSAGPTWTPPGTILIVRHRALDGGRRIVTNDRTPPPGFEIEFDLGLVHLHAQPGTVRLVAARDDFFCTPFEGELRDDLWGLGFVEQAPLPMLVALELRREPSTGQQVLVAGPADPLFDSAEPLGVVGFVESYPINPREPLGAEVERGLVTLRRTVDEVAWRHGYEIANGTGAGAVALGGAWDRPRLDSEPLLIDTDGVVTSSLLDPLSRSRPTPKEIARWVGAPVSWTGRRPRLWAMRATASRARQLRRSLPDQVRGSSGETRVLCYLPREPAPGWSPLFAARHPVLGDSYLTRSALEASDLGYIVEGFVGYVADRRSDTLPEAQPPEVKWASRFGQRRRYVEGQLPD